MKNIKSFMLIFSIVLILGAIVVGSCSAQTTTNYLKIKGKILNEHRSDIYIYAQDETTDKWIKTTSKSNKSKYTLRLATDKNYQIVYISDSGQTKILHIKKGEFGMFIEFVDIDFSDNKEKHACLYQKNNYEYAFQSKVEIFTASLE